LGGQKYIKYNKITIQKTSVGQDLCKVSSTYLVGGLTPGCVPLLASLAMPLALCKYATVGFGALMLFSHIRSHKKIEKT